MNRANDVPLDLARVPVAILRGNHDPIGEVPGQGKGGHASGSHAVDAAGRHLDRSGIVVASADDDGVLDAPHDMKLAVRQVAEVARLHPTIDEDFPRALFVVPVPIGHAGALHEDLTDIPFRQCFLG